MYSKEELYKRIYEIAKTMPIIHHPIVKESVAIKNNYFGMLLMIAASGDSICEEQLLFMQRIILGDADNSRFDYYLGNLGTIERENVLFKMDATIKEKYADLLLVDMMILTKLSKGQTRNAYEIISNIAAFLNKDKASLKSVSEVARDILMQRIGIHYKDYNQVFAFNEKYGHYLSEIAGWENLMREATVEQLRKEKRNYEDKEVSKAANFYMSEEEEYGSDWYYYKD